MLHTPVTDRKYRADSTNSTKLVDREQQHQTVGRFSDKRDRPNMATIQQAYGNQAALRMLKSQKPPVVNPLQGGLLQRKCACGNAAGAAGTCAECQEKQEMALQTKLRISEPGDKYEREADRIADEVMQMPEPSVQRQVEPEKEEMVQRKACATPISPVSEGQDELEVPSIVYEVLRSPGQPLDTDTRAFMESRFEHDFSQVRVHTSDEADESSRAIGASAYTVKDRVVFARGNYAPESAQGRQLLAHELTHVVQQRAGMQQSSPLVQRQEIAPDTPEVTPLYTVSTGSVQVPQGRGGTAGSVDTETFFVRTPATLRISATARYIGSSTNVSDWSVQLFRRTMWGADEPIGERKTGRVGNTLDFSVFADIAPTLDYYLRFRNASQYESISVTYTVTG